MENLQGEWKDLIGFVGLYKISDLGDIISLKSNRLLKPKKDKYYVLFDSNGNRKNVTKNALVANNFPELFSMDTYKEWKDIEGFKGVYRVSNTGEVMSMRSGRLISAHDNGYFLYNGHGKYTWFRKGELLEKCFGNTTVNENEVWANIDGLGGDYQISNLGNVRNLRMNAIMKTKNDKFCVSYHNCCKTYNVKSLLRVYFSQQDDNEDWKDIKTFEGVYQISSLGRVRNTKMHNKILKPTKSNSYMLSWANSRYIVSAKSLLNEHFGTNTETNEVNTLNDRERHLLSAFYTNNYPKAIRYLKKYFDSNSAHDILQEAFMYITKLPIQYKERFLSDSHDARFLFHIIKKKIIWSFGKMNRERKLMKDFLSTVSNHSIFQTDMIGLTLNFKNVSENSRKILDMYNNHYSVPEISKELGIRHKEIRTVINEFIYENKRHEY